MMIYNQTKCPVCGSLNASQVKHTSSKWGGMIPYLQFCEECGCVYVDDGARELAKENRRIMEKRKKQEEAVDAAIREKLKKYE